VIYQSSLAMNPLDVFEHVSTVPSGEEKLEISIGSQKIFITDREDPFKLSRPFVKSRAYEFSAVEKLYDEGRQSFVTRNYSRAQEKLEACLELDPGHQSARIGYAELLYRNALYENALENVNLALENDFYDFDANYIAGIIYMALDKPIDALEALGWAARSMQYRSAAYALMSEIHLGIGNYDQSLFYARQSLDYNIYNISTYKVLAVVHRKTNNQSAAQKVIEKILEIDPLNHFARFEKYLLSKRNEDLSTFASLIQNEMPYQSYLELGMDYLRIKKQNEAIDVLSISPAHPLVDLWLSYLTRTNDPERSEKHFEAAIKQSPEFVFPFREETLSVLEWANQRSNNWRVKYYLGLNLWAKNRNNEAVELFEACKNEPDYAPFYLTRAVLLDGNENYDKRKDIEKALGIDIDQWRTWHTLNQYLDDNKLYKEQLAAITKAYKRFKDNYVIGMAYAQALLNNKKYDQSIKLLDQINVLPHEGAREGRNIYEQVYLFSALEDLQKGNYSKAKTKVIKSLEWPENLGVGEPYVFDKRQQDYLLAYIYYKTNQKQNAENHLRQIVEYSKSNNDRHSLNQLLGLKAMKKIGEMGEVGLLINSLQGSNGSFARWVVHYWKDDATNLKNVEKEISENKDFILFSEIIKRTADFD
jgi:tetratricopeptide (TPR) repeat protein